MENEIKYKEQMLVYTYDTFLNFICFKHNTPGENIEVAIRPK